MGKSAGCSEVLGACQAAGCGNRVHQRDLMLRIEMIEIHAAAPLRKRERGGLSAKGAYISSALDHFNIGIQAAMNKGHGRFDLPLLSGQISVLELATK
jgi:hypothetical protein